MNLLIGRWYNMTLIVVCDICGAESDPLEVTEKCPEPWPKAVRTNADKKAGRKAIGWLELYDHQACPRVACQKALREGHVPSQDDIDYP